MILITPRKIIPFQPGSSLEYTLINGENVNLTTLFHYNYTLYSNGTLSNGSVCVLAFERFKPQILVDGQFVNATSCYSPAVDICQHGQLGITFAVLFALSIVFSLSNLCKHGKRHLPVERRWRAVGRRWQWYWLVAMSVSGVLSCFMSIDVDRDFLSGTPIMLQSIFFYLMLPLMLAAVWESVRHWGSWQERQVFDRDPFELYRGNRSTREVQEFCLPILFYACAGANFILGVPHSWSGIEHQSSPDQVASLAEPAATSTRFKAAAFAALAAWLVTCYSLTHSLYRYRPWRKRRLQQQQQDHHDPSTKLEHYVTACPLKFALLLFLGGVRVSYTIVAAFDWSVSPFKEDVSAGWIFGMGYAPCLLILVVFNVAATEEDNEDLILLDQRKARNRNRGLLHRTYHHDESEGEEGTADETWTRRLWKALKRRRRGDKSPIHENYVAKANGGKSNVRAIAAGEASTGNSLREDGDIGMCLEMGVMVLEDHSKNGQQDDGSTKPEENGALPTESTMSSTLAPSSDSIGDVTTTASGEQVEVKPGNPQIAWNILDK